MNKKIKDDLLAAIQKCLQEFYGDNPATSPDFARIIHPKHFDRLVKLLKNGKIIVGGESNSEESYIAPKPKLYQTKNFAKAMM